MQCELQLSLEKTQEGFVKNISNCLTCRKVLLLLVGLFFLQDETHLQIELLILHVHCASVQIIDNIKIHIRKCTLNIELL